MNRIKALTSRTGPKQVTLIRLASKKKQSLLYFPHLLFLIYTLKTDIKKSAVDKFWQVQNEFEATRVVRFTFDSPNFFFGSLFGKILTDLFFGEEFVG